MKAMGHRVRRLEKQFAVPTGPRERWRVVLSAVHRAANLANSRCTRTLNSFGLLTEIVELDGRRDSVTDEELERFIESFPVEQADDRRSPG